MNDTLYLMLIVSSARDKKPAKVTRRMDKVASRLHVTAVTECIR